MFVAKVYHERKLVDIAHYRVFQNALADICNKRIFQNVPKEIVDTLGNPEIRYFSLNNETNTADDFEFCFSNGVMVYLGEVNFADSLNKYASNEY